MAVVGLSLAANVGIAADTVGNVQINHGLSETTKAWLHAVESGDAEAISRLNAESVVVYGVDSDVTWGKKAVVADYAKMFDKYSARVDIYDAGWVRQGPLLNSWGQFTLILEPKTQAAGQTVKIDGRFSDAAVWSDGRWQYVMDHASVAAK